jgi:NADP-dependent 3-hydroxy acid dehydrogenase YdfG
MISRRKHVLKSEQKVAVVTGSSAGIGRETELLLLRAGYQVHAGARRLEAMTDLNNARAFLHHLDLTSPQSIEAFCGPGSQPQRSCRRAD